MFSPSVTAVRALFLTRSLRSWEEVRRSGRQFERSSVVKSGGALLRLAAAHRDGSSIGSGKDERLGSASERVAEVVGGRYSPHGKSVCVLDGVRGWV